MPNVFREAKQLWDKRGNGIVLTKKEENLVETVASFTANLLPQAFPKYDNLPVSEGLEELAEMMDGHC